MSESRDNGFGTPTWRQFASSRDRMLSGYDLALSQCEHDLVKVEHGNKGEALVREWLESFLPRRYGVTAGYIVSSDPAVVMHVDHYDVIIYDQLESPVLWHRDNPAVSSVGLARAIPIEYVLCVLEVKAAFNRNAVKKALLKLDNLVPGMCACDLPHSVYKRYLPRHFSCGLVFFELRKENALELSALESISRQNMPREFIGGVIFRGEGHRTQSTGLIEVSNPNATMITDSGVGPQNHFNEEHGLLFRFSSTGYDATSCLGIRPTLLTWFEHNFARFAFDIIAIIQQRYRPGYISSFHGIGGSSDGFSNSS